MALPASPRARRLSAPSWLDTRFVLGLLLVLVSVVVGARVLAGADRADSVYAVTHDLAGGTPLLASDLRPVRVRLLDDRAGYVSAVGPKPVGYVLDRPLGADEFLPRRALRVGTPAEMRLVTVPVATHHYPAELRHGDVVDLYVSPKALAGGAPSAPVLVAPRVLVNAVSDADGSRLSSTAGVGIALRVPVARVARVVAAGQGAVDLVRIPSEPPGPSADGSR
jgi:hypothetical protein